MKRWLVIGSVAALVLVAGSVFALQGRNAQTPVAQEVSARTADGSYSGCGGSAGCGSSAGCGGATGGCGASATSAEENQERLGLITAYPTDYYGQKLGTSDVQVQIEDFACHQEATVSSGGQVVDKLSVSGNKITKIEG